MTVKELIRELKQMPQDAQVYMVKDWEQIDENQNLTDLYGLYSVDSQTVVIDRGLDFEDTTEVLLGFEENRY